MRGRFLPALPYAFFRNAWQRFRPQGRMRLLVASGPQERLFAGSIFFYFGSTVAYAFNASWEPGLRLRANDAVHYRAIQDACVEGYRRMDFGEVTESNPGLTSYKKKWGSYETQLYRFYYPRSRDFAAVGDAEPRVSRRLAERIWQFVPLQGTAIVGKWVLRYL
jgi:hypothetical protein